MQRAVFLLLLPLLGLSGALRDEWKPGEFPATQPGALLFLDAYNTTAEDVFYFSVSANWRYNTNLTSHNSELQVSGRAAGSGWRVTGPGAQLVEQPVEQGADNSKIMQIFKLWKPTSTPRGKYLKLRLPVCLDMEMVPDGLG